MTSSKHTFFCSPFTRYLAPLFTFLLFSALDSINDDPQLIWLFYGVKMIVVSWVLFFLFKGHWHEIEGSFDLRSIWVGGGVAAIWLVHYEIYAPEASAIFNPELLDSNIMMIGAIVIRILGACLVIPLLEELVWRSFMMRWLIKDDFLSVPLGTYTHFAFWASVLAFAVVHPMWQWSVAAVAGIAYGAYLVRTKNLKGCIIAHAVTNLSLSLYALNTKNWGLWG